MGEWSFISAVPSQFSTHCLLIPLLCSVRRRHAGQSRTEFILYSIAQSLHLHYSPGLSLLLHPSFLLFPLSPLIFLLLIFGPVGEPMGNQESKISSTPVDVRKFSHFAQNDLRDWSAQFDMAYPSGAMEQQDMDALLLSLFPSGSVSQFSEMLFQTINIGQTGYIDFNELLIAFSIMARGSEYERLRWIFRFYDRDKDGVVSREEMVDAVKGLYNMVRPVVEEADTPEELVDKMFSCLDNKSGFLSFNDFEALSRHKDGMFSRAVMFTMQ